MKPFIRRLMFAVVIVALLSVSFSVFAQSTTPPPISKEGQQTKDQLLAEFKTALENELSNGQTEVNPQDGSIMLVGESQTKIDLLWKDTVSQIEKAIGRSPEEQKAFKDRIAVLDGSYPEYIMRTVFPYNPDVAIEKYSTEKYTYSVDMATGQILEVMPIDSTRFRREANSGNSSLSADELEQQAVSYINSVDTNLDLGNLQPNFSDKDGRNYFFRWEDPTKTLPDGMTPFVQVGLSSWGELLNYVNTLSVAQQKQASLIEAGLFPQPVFASFNEIYANGGGYWSWLAGGSSSSTTSNAGYCYIAGWCSPTNFYWGYTDATTSPNTPYINGQWDVNASSQYIYLLAYVPSTNATAYAKYTATYNNGSNTDSATIDQSVYSNVWVSVLGSHFNYGVVKLDNDDDTAGFKVAWDEVWLCTSDICP